MNCYIECGKILERRKGKGIIRKVINKKNPWGDNLVFEIEHIKGNFKTHYVVSVEGTIIDPFLQERGQIPEEDYLRIIYKNHEELKMVDSAR